MSTLNQVEFQNLKKLIISKTIDYEKFMNYSENAVDPQIKQVLNKAAQDSLNTKQKLLTFIKV